MDRGIVEMIVFSLLTFLFASSVATNSSSITITTTGTFSLTTIEVQTTGEVGSGSGEDSLSLVMMPSLSSVAASSTPSSTNNTSSPTSPPSTSASSQTNTSVISSPSTGASSPTSTSVRSPLSTSATSQMNVIVPSSPSTSTSSSTSAHTSSATSTSESSTTSTTAAPVDNTVIVVVAVVGIFAIILLSVVAFALLFIAIKMRRSKYNVEMVALLEGIDSNNIALKDFSLRPSGSKINLEAYFAHIPEIEDVMVADLEEHMNTMNEQDEDGGEFLRVQENDQSLSAVMAKSAAVAEKNRYINILPFDQTRVILSDFPKISGSNYINANYISGYNNKTEYIATQGPLHHTIADFWRMVWEQGTQAIVMVTNPIEGGIAKCEVYWPSCGNSQQYGIVMVTNMQEEIIPTCTIRKIMLSVAHKAKNKDRQVLTREIMQFCYTGWPDMGVPEDVSSMLKYVHRVRSYVSEEHGPIVVHCSAGVGRSGTFIAIDAQLQKMTQEGAVNVPEFVMQMRSQRCFMVQTEPQYMFIYRTLLYAYLYGNTELKKSQISSHIEKLHQAFPNTEDSFMDKEYFGATNVPKPEEKEISTALIKNNINKNRSQTFLPLDKNRVLLSDPEAIGNDYINASFVGVLGRNTEYIVTEHPLPGMVEEFWKMVLDRSISTIVMIGPVPDEEEIYWPDNMYSKECDSLSVQLLSLESEDGINALEVEVECEETEACQTVKLFQLTSWPTDDGEVPTSTDELLKLIQIIHEHSKGKILVHSSCCLKGEASGVFCMVNSLSHKIKRNETVDIMNTTKHLLSQRPGAIISKEQYLFIYEALSK